MSLVHTAVEDLLRSLFSGAELRRFVANRYEGLLADLGDPDVIGLTEYAHRLVGALDRHGRLTGAFFDTVRDERPLRCNDIELAKMKAFPVERRARHNLPFLPRGFVGRSDELRRLEAVLQPGRPVAILEREWAGITGMGGIGKTQLAVRYAYEHLADYDTVCWVDAEGGDVAAGLARLAVQPLGLGQAATLSFGEIVRAVRATLEDGRRHLVIFDNVTEPGSFERYLPRDGASSVLVTSRRRDLQGVTALDLGVLPKEHGLEILRGPFALQDAEECAAHELGEDVGWLTLVIAVAGRILAQRGWHPSMLLQRIRAQGAVGWSSQAPLDHLFRKNPSLAVLFEASLEQLDPALPCDVIARQMLFAAGWLAPVGIPGELLLHSAQTLAQQDLRPDVAVDAAMRLVSLGLAEITDRNELEFHRIVGEFARLRGEPEARSAVVLAATAVAAHLDWRSESFLQTLDKYESHFRAIEGRRDDTRDGDDRRIAYILVEADIRRGELDRSLSLIDAVLKQKLGRGWAGPFHILRAHALRLKGDHEEALAAAKLALGLTQAEGCNPPIPRGVPPFASM